MFAGSDADPDCFELRVLGVEMLVRHDSSHAHLQEIETLLRHRLEVTQEFSKARDPLKVAILTAFRLVSDLMEERSERATLPSISMTEGREIENLVEEMLEMLPPTLLRQASVDHELVAQEGDSLPN